MEANDLGFVIRVIKEIENGFLDLQESQLGRLKKLPKFKNIQYVSSSDLLQKHGFDSFHSCLGSNSGAFFRDLFGMHPENLMEDPTDEELGVIDATWLGLMPEIIDSIVKTNIKKCNFYKIDREIASQKRDTIYHQWNEVKALIMGKAIGIHRILSTVSETITTELKKLHPLPIEKTSPKRKWKPQDSAPSKKIKKKDTPKIQCGGITCGELKKIWCKHSNFGQNMIEINRKHCQRCSVHCTASNIAVDILTQLESCNNKQQKKFMDIIRKTSAEARNRYTPLMNELKICIPKCKHFIRAQYISKQRPTEKWKRICNIIFNLMRYIGLQTQYDNPSKIITRTAQFINQKMKESTQQVKEQKKIINSYMKELQQQYKPNDAKPTVDQINNDLPFQVHSSTPTISPSCANRIETTVPSPSNIIVIHDESETTTTNEDDLIPSQDIDQMMQERLHIMNPRNLMSGTTLTMAIEVLRDKFQSNSTYIACSNASEMIATWNSSQGWPRFARMFYNRHVCHSKPNGLYLIPMFESGHWYLVAIYKNRRIRKAAILDSLGSGNIHNTLHETISAAFTHNRGQPTWTAPTSIRQQRVECGSRVICMMNTLCEAHATGEDFEGGLRRATLTEKLDQSTYDQMSFRRKAATLIGTYRRRMRTDAVRIRLSR